MDGMIFWSICVSMSLVAWLIWPKRIRPTDQEEKDHIDAEFTVIDDFKLDIRV